MNFKKASVFIASIFALFFIYSCGESEMDQSFGIEDETELHELITPYLFLNDTKYELRLSKQEALKKGISGDQYDEIYYDLQQLNAYIEDQISKPNHKITLNDPQQKNEIVPAPLTRDVETSDGSIHALRDYYGANSSLSVSIPRGYKQISVTVTPKCFFSAVTIGIGSMHETFVWGGGTVNYTVGMSPSYVSIQIASNCDKGGTIGYTISK